MPKHHPAKRGGRDDFQTPEWAVRPLHKYIPDHWTVWEPACGAGLLVEEMLNWGNPILATDLYDTYQDQACAADFLTCHPHLDFDESPSWDCIITNPPYSIKEEWIGRCYYHGAPWALLMPYTGLEGRKKQAMYREYGIELLLFPKRINFILLDGSATTAWFPTAWFTWGLNIGQQLTFLTEEDWE